MPLQHVFMELYKQASRVLPKQYEELGDLNPVALCNKRKVYNMLFTAVSQTLLTFGRNPENGLGGKLGLIAILHTWNQKLEDHIHLHGVVPGGVLSRDHASFVPCKKDFLFPVRALSKVFRGKFMELLEAAYERGCRFPRAST